MAGVLTVLMGFATPVQKGINNRLRERTGNLFTAAVVSFNVRR